MFELTKKSEYGLRLMVYLAKNAKQGQIPLKKISREEKLPYRFLSQLTLDLKQAGLLKAKEGIGGGFSLAKPAAKIKVAEMLEALGGPIELVECLQAEASCPWQAVCGQKKLFEELKGSLKKIINAHTLADLAK